MVDRKLLYRWCSIRVEDLENHPDLKLPFRLVKNSEEMGELMAKELAEDIKKANITVRNFPATVAEIRKRTKLSDGGETYLFATTLSNDQKVLIRCSKVSSNS